MGLEITGCLPALFVVVTCAALNLAGIRVVGITSLWLFFLLSAPLRDYRCMAPMRAGALCAGRAHQLKRERASGLLGGVLVAMWNYMGWDNASTIAQEVEKPQRTYPKAMIAAVILVSLTYVLAFRRCVLRWAFRPRRLRKTARGRRSPGWSAEK